MWTRSKVMTELIPKISLTSKASVKTQCLYLAKGDIDQAERIYDFLVKDMDLPDNEPVKPTTMSQITNTAGGIFGWLKENKEDLTQVVDLVRGFIPSKPTNIITDLPPINKA